MADELSARWQRVLDSLREGRLAPGHATAHAFTRGAPLFRHEGLRSFVGMLRSEHGPQDTGRR